MRGENAAPAHNAIAKTRMEGAESALEFLLQVTDMLARMQEDWGNGRREKGRIRRATTRIPKTLVMASA